MGDIKKKMINLFKIFRKIRNSLPDDDEEGRNFFEILGFLLILAFVIGAIYFFFNGKNLPSIWKFVSNPFDRSSSSASPTPEPSPDEHEDLRKIAETQKAIEEAINSKRYADLEPYMAKKVEVEIKNGDCCGKKDPDEAVEKLQSLSIGEHFSFDQRSEHIMNLKIKNQQLAEEFVGVSDVKPREDLAAFSIGPDGKITKIQLTNSWKMYGF